MRKIVLKSGDVAIHNEEMEWECEDVLKMGIEIFQETIPRGPQYGNPPSYVFNQVVLWLGDLVKSSTDTTEYLTLPEVDY